MEIVVNPCLRLGMEVSYVSLLISISHLIQMAA